MNYIYTLWLGSTDIPKTSRPFQKPRCQKRYIKEVHNLKFRHCIGVVAHNLKILEYVCHLNQSCVFTWRTNFCVIICAVKLCVIFVTTRGIMHTASAARTCQPTGDADDWNSQGVSATFSLPLRETSSSLGMCVTRGQRDHVIAPHSIVSLGMRGKKVG